jgi:hypothetical protein
VGPRAVLDAVVKRKIPRKYGQKPGKYLLPFISGSIVFASAN